MSFRVIHSSDSGCTYYLPHYVQVEGLDDDDFYRLSVFVVDHYNDSLAKQPFPSLTALVDFTMTALSDASFIATLHYRNLQPNTTP